MPLSARNHLPGIIDDIQMGDVMAHVSVRVGDNIVDSVITRRSAEEMGLKKGDRVTAVVKATEVMLSKEWSIADSHFKPVETDLNIVYVRDTVVRLDCFPEAECDWSVVVRYGVLSSWPRASVYTRRSHSRRLQRVRSRAW